MARWLIKLNGDKLDLEDYKQWFPNGDAFVLEENGDFFLAGDTFELISSPNEIEKKATEIIDSFSGAISLICRSHKRPGICTIYRESDDGKRNQYVSLSMPARSRARFINKPPESDVTLILTQAQAILKSSESSIHLKSALALCGDGNNTWPRLYRILEEIERHLGTKVDNAGLWSKNIRRRFTHSANNAETAGKDSRHAKGNNLPPRDPMTLDEARKHIQDLLLKVIQNN